MKTDFICRLKSEHSNCSGKNTPDKCTFCG